MMTTKMRGHQLYSDRGRAAAARWLDRVVCGGEVVRCCAVHVQNYVIVILKLCGYDPPDQLVGFAFGVTRAETASFVCNRP